ncbi:hypothetical protein Psp6_00017 [Pseudomonas phage Psp6]|nr:hypothetical protein Psp6_00017 [Pseudomonas phage Psp6]
MNPGQIKGATAVMCAPQGMEDSCAGLPIIQTDDGWQISRWDPTPEERGAIYNGAYVRLWVMGPHPVISIDTEGGRLDPMGRFANLEILLRDEQAKVKLLRQALERLQASAQGMDRITQIALDATA